MSACRSNGPAKLRPSAKSCTKEYSCNCSQEFVRVTSYAKWSLRQFKHHSGSQKSLRQKNLRAQKCKTGGLKEDFGSGHTLSGQILDRFHCTEVKGPANLHMVVQCGAHLQRPQREQPPPIRTYKCSNQRRPLLLLPPFLPPSGPQALTAHPRLKPLFQGEEVLGRQLSAGAQCHEPINPAERE